MAKIAAPPQDWHPADVLAALKKRRSSLSAVARTLGVQPCTVWKGLRLPYPRVEQAVAEVLGVPPQAIWPSRYAHRAAPQKAEALAP